MVFRLSLCAALAAAAVALPAAAADAAAGTGTDLAAGQPGAWRSQKTELVYLGFTSHYSCDGLQGKLELLLRQLGARRDFKVVTYGCDRGYGQPSRFPRAALEFATLQPGSVEAAPVPPSSSGPLDEQPVAGAWRSVELSPRHPFDLQDGDCELMEQFRDKVLPLFAVRDLQANLACVPHQDNGPFALQMQVFAPLVSAKPK